MKCKIRQKIFLNYLFLNSLYFISINSLPIDDAEFYEYPELTNSINPRLKPCDDFYEYVCDGYRKDKALEFLQGNHERIDNFQGTMEKADQKLIAILSLPSFRDKYKDDALYSKAYDFYDACVDLEARDEAKEETMKLLFDELRAVRQKMKAEYIMNTEWLSAVYPVIPLETKHLMAGPALPFVFPFHMFRPIPLTAPKTGKYAGNEDAWLYEFSIFEPPPPPIADANLHSLEAVLALVMHDDLEMNGKKPVLVPKGIPAKNEMAMQQFVGAWLNNVRAIDMQLAQIFGKYNATKAPPERLSLKEIHQKFTTSIDWVELLNGIDSRLNANTKVMLKCGNCFREIEQFIVMQSKQNPIGLKQYLETYIIMKYFHAFDPRFREFTWGKLIPNGPQRITTEAICMARTATHFEKQLDRLYIDNFFKEDDQNIVVDMIRQIKAEFKAMLEEADWMEDETQQKALSKLAEMNRLVGYFDVIQEDDVLEKENRCYNFENTNNFGEMEMLASKCTNRRNIRTNVRVDDEHQALFYLDKYVHSFEPNGLYAFTRNIFIVLAAILQTPFFSKEMPKALRFGGVGVLIAHEITHGFDNKGRLYNEEGRKENWWDKKTKKEFLKRTRCFVEQYSKFMVTIDALTQMPVDGKLTLGENIADNGGLKASFRAFQAVKRQRELEGSKRKLVQRMKSFTDEQLFFVNYAFTFCSVESAQFLRGFLQHDFHSPNRARINLVVGNSQNFVDAFGCKEGDPMFIPSEERCELW